jgi:REP element-mobilizing transposase RayT
MARKPRIHLPGGVYHVMLRGNGGQGIFFRDADRAHLTQLLQDGIDRFGYRIHAFCWMTNHLHLALQVADVPLSKIMHNVAFRYTRWINQQQRRVGHLFQGRYHAVLVETDPYLVALVRYIHLNPVRAGLVSDPAAYPWSGHRAYLGQETQPWLTTEWVLSLLAQREATARRRYAQFVQEGLQQGYREEFHRGATDTRVLGSDTFMEQAVGTTQSTPVKPPSLDEVVTGVCTVYELPEAQLRSRGRSRHAAEARAMIAWLAVHWGSATLTAVGQRFGRDVATLSITVRRLKERAQHSEALQQRLACFGVEEEV